jgi:Flp pilus assembly protein TadG
MAARMRKASKAGSAALEFAFVAPIFFLLLMGTLEVGIMFVGSFILQNATADAARQIRTGQVALGNVSQAQFRQLVCAKMPALLQCDSHLQIDVQTFANFGSVALPNPVRADGTLDPSLNNWAPGSVCSIVLVRSFYTWDVATPFLTPFLVNMANNQHLLSAAAAFRNEPYTTAVAGC